MTAPSPSGPHESRAEWPPPPAPAATRPRSTTWSTGALIGLGLASIVILTVGVAGPIVGLAWGQSIGRDLRGGSPSSGICLSDCGADDGDSSGTAPADPDALAAPKDWTIDENMPFASAPLLSAQTPDGWESVDIEDGERAAYGQRASGCLFIVDEEIGLDATDGRTDAAATRTMIDDFAASMTKDSRYSSTTVRGNKPLWVSLNAGDGRVQFAVEQIDYTLADSGEKWNSYLLVRAFTRPATVSYATLDCPATATVDEPFASLSIQGS